MGCQQKHSHLVEIALSGMLVELKRRVTLIFYRMYMECMAQHSIRTVCIYCIVLGIDECGNFYLCTNIRYFLCISDEDVYKEFGWMHRLYFIITTLL